MNRSVWFPGDLAERIEAEASKQDRSFNWVVVKALESALGDPAGVGHVLPDPGSTPRASSRASGATEAELQGLKNLVDTASSPNWDDTEAHKTVQRDFAKSRNKDAMERQR